MNQNTFPRSRGLNILAVLAILVAITGASGSARSVAAPLGVAGAAGPSAAGYSFKNIVTLGDPAPGGGTYMNDFEPWGLNNRGEASFASDTALGEAGYLADKSGVHRILRTGDPAPGGGTVGTTILAHQAINEQGDTVAAWLRDPAPNPFGLNAAVYRYSHATGQVTALMLPGMPAPGGATFQGAFYHASLNNRGDAVFPGIISPTQGINGNPLGIGIFKADKAGSISNVASPGDLVPEGRLDATINPWINDSGDVAFSGHVAGEECIDVFGHPLLCGESIYLKRGATGQTLSIAHQGAAIPPSAGGGTYHYAWGAVVNNRDEIVFIGDLSAPGEVCQSNGVFLWRAGQTYKVARPGDAMPGGGHMLTATCVTGDYSVDNSGDIAYNITLDTTTGGVNDTGLYVQTATASGARVVARTGTVVPGLGTIATVKPPFGLGGATLNDRGQLLFQAGFTDGSQRLLVATPNQ